MYSLKRPDESNEDFHEYPNLSGLPRRQSFIPTRLWHILASLFTPILSSVPAYVPVASWNPAGTGARVAPLSVFPGIYMATIPAALVDAVSPSKYDYIQPVSSPTDRQKIGGVLPLDSGR